MGALGGRAENTKHIAATTSKRKIFKVRVLRVEGRIKTDGQMARRPKSARFRMGGETSGLRGISCFGEDNLESPYSENQTRWPHPCCLTFCKSGHGEIDFGRLGDFVCDRYMAGTTSKQKYIKVKRFKTPSSKINSSPSPHVKEYPLDPKSQSQSEPHYLRVTEAHAASGASFRSSSSLRCFCLLASCLAISIRCSTSRKEPVAPLIPHPLLGRWLTPWLAPTGKRLLYYC